MGPTRIAPPADEDACGMVRRGALVSPGGILYRAGFAFVPTSASPPAAIWPSVRLSPEICSCSRLGRGR